jgi:IS30 family transposase
VNASGQLRRELPRKTRLADHADADIEDVVWNLNTMPRNASATAPPIEVFATNLGVALEM